MTTDKNSKTTSAVHFYPNLLPCWCSADADHGSPTYQSSVVRFRNLVKFNMGFLENYQTYSIIVYMILVNLEEINLKMMSIAKSFSAVANLTALKFEDDTKYGNTGATFNTVDVASCWMTPQNACLC